ncbi:MAG: hypothetical protein QXG71_01415 [Nanopusillaceae archaeon]
MDLIPNILETIYEEVTLPIINFIANIPVLISKLILFILIVALGYVVSRFLDFIARIILSYIRIDDVFKEKNLENAFFKIKPSIYIRNLLKYYIYFYFILEGLKKANLINITLLPYLNTFYIILLVVSIGFLISAILEKYLRVFTDKKIALELFRGLIIYIFFIWALEITNLPSSIFYEILDIFLITISISLGLFIGIILALEYREEIKKIIR